MTAHIGGRQMHPVYGTVPLAGHVEQVCRAIIDPHLEEGEDAVGHSLELSHRAPVPVGATVELTATVAEVGPQRLKCEFMARSRGTIVARGSFEQRVVNRDEFLTRAGAGLTNV